MKDAKGNVIEAGVTLRRVIDGRAVYAGQQYTVIARLWDDDDQAESLIADAGFIRELITPERALEYEVSEQN